MRSRIISKDGWIISTMIEHSRNHRRYMEASPADSRPVDRETLRAAFKIWSGFHLKADKPTPDDMAKDGEVVWTLQNISLLFVGAEMEFIRFLGPSKMQIKILRSEKVENNKKAKAAKSERSEIGKGMRRGSLQGSSIPSTARRL